MRDLLLALLCLILWVIFVFVRPIGAGPIHILLGVGATLLVRWWALRQASA